MESKTGLALPEELRRQFVAVGRRLWAVETTVALACGLGAVGLSLLALFISDRFWETPVWLRLMLFAAGVAGAAAAGFMWANRWVWHRRDTRGLARLVQRKYRHLGDRLLGIVELSNEQHHDANFSPALYQAAIRQVAKEAARHDFAASVNARPARQAGMMAAGIALVLLLAAAILPAATANALARWGAPWVAIPRYTLVTLEGLPSTMTVPHGEPFAVSAAAHYRSFWKPARVRGEIMGEPLLEGNVAGDRARLQVAGQTENETLRVRLGDAEATVKLEPVHRPALQNLEAQVQLPAYLRYTNETRSIQDGSLTTVEGSKVTFRGTVSRTLAVATMARENDTNTPLRVTGENFASPELEPSGLAQFTFNWRDELGLSNAAPLRISAFAEKDAPPTVDLPDMPQEIAMLASDALRVEVEAVDDYGVRDLGLTWEADTETPLAGTATTEMKFMTDAPTAKKAQRVFRWSPSLLRLQPGTLVELQGFARDYLPQRARARTAAHRVRILSAEDHAELVRQQLEATMAQLEDVTRLQEKIAATAEDVQAATNMPESQKSSRMGDAKEDQTQNAAKLKELSQQGERAVEEAMKNPIFKEESIQQWNATMQQWQKMADQQMKEAAQAMQAAQQNSKSRDQDVADAKKKAEDILQALQKMQSKANEHMDDMQALTLAHRLRKVGAEEKDIGGQLLASAADTIGLPPQDLPSKFKRLEFGLTKDQGHSQEETTRLENEIGRFFERTKKPNYGDVTREMKDSHVADDLDRVAGLIDKNIGMDASASLAQWSERFAAWGDKLEPKSAAAGGQGASASGEEKKQQDLTKQLIALLRLREQQLNVRDDADALEQSKGDAKDYADQARSLAARQEKISGGVEQVHHDTPIEALDPAFADTTGAMAQAQSFLNKPETDKPADEAQVKAVDSLTDLINLINEQAQKPKPQSSPSPGQSASEEMQFLLQAMKQSSSSQAMGLKPATGLNHNGGSTDRAGRAVAGDARGQTGPGRTVQKSSGSGESVPAEYRDALDNYYHGLEQKN
jgi:hypothetical protein